MIPMMRIILKLHREYYKGGREKILKE